MEQYSKILTAYRQHKPLDISYQTVRRVLITAGLYTSPRVERIRELSAAGFWPWSPHAVSILVSKTRLHYAESYRKSATFFAPQSIDK